MEAANDYDSTFSCLSRKDSVVINIEANENTPLLEKRKFEDLKSSDNCKLPRLLDFHLLGFAIILIGGMTIASYLLIKEGGLPIVSFTLDLVNRDVWSQFTLPLGRKLNETKGVHVIMVQTGGSTCADLETCADILRNMQKAQGTDSEIPFNFLISENGQAYEARGWNYESGLSFLPQQTSLVIGFIGNYTSVSPTDAQCTSALSVIHEFMRRKRLHTSYQLFGIRNLSISQFDGEALFSRISRWHRFDTLLHVL